MSQSRHIPSVPSGVVENYVTHRRAIEVDSDEMKQLTIVLLGEIDAGKSTFVNAAANYLAYEELEQAELDEPLTLVPAAFGYYDPDVGEVLPVRSRQLALYNRGDGAAYKNEIQVSGHKTTQSPRTYVQQARLPSGQAIQVKLIDTPGMGDARGPQQDRATMCQIISYLSNYPKIDCFMFLVKSSNSRPGTWFLPCLKDLLKRFPDTKAADIAFVFTHARTTLFRPGDTMKMLKALLDHSRRNGPMDISISSENLLMVDNEAYLYLLAREQTLFSANDEENFEASWDRSSESWYRLLTRLAGIPWDPQLRLPARKKARQAVLNLHKSLVDTALSTVSDVGSLNSQISALDSKQVDVAELQKSLKMVVSRPVRSRLLFPVMVCTHPDCVRSIRSGSGECIPTYVARCQEPCYLANTSDSRVEDQIRKCPSMRRGSCRKCHHRYTFHKPFDSEVEHRQFETEDPKVQSQIEAAESSNADMRRKIGALQEAVDDLESEQREIMKTLAWLATFVQKGHDRLQNDVFKESIDRHIRDAQETLSSQAPGLYHDGSMLTMLLGLREFYEHEKSILSEGISNRSRASLTVNDILDRMNRLFALERTGSAFKALAHQSILAYSK
ncbi:uncharacterized protein BJ171DRAFT_485613 [Polychytrium aggregatum]|uniref:uncharacterized protein n=1 Tax=Polychytrium aggregatum TaxID=110093 RepID=UPI0022FE1881|nr:uncharacterized protein BJ171DRAFT_485613 [Polychytrium aggregatum]KAI9209939.1 hypothetical protein BJ171DRAFT_485613 [Polychytrium aggregatum]